MSMTRVMNVVHIIQALGLPQEVILRLRPRRNLKLGVYTARNSILYASLRFQMPAMGFDPGYDG